MEAINFPYDKINQPELLPKEFMLGDHLGGFDSLLQNPILDKLNEYAGKNNFQFILHTDQLYDQIIHQRYTNLKILLSLDSFQQYNCINRFKNYLEHPSLSFDNFLCSFNGSAHVSRKILVAVLNRFGFFNPQTCSKNFSFTIDEIDGHLRELSTQSSRFYRKFFIGPDSQDFFQWSNNFGSSRLNHAKNISCLDQKIASCFVHIVAETMATSYYPYVTEKFVYSIVTRGLFVAYGQPGWHHYLERYLGFKKYNNIFDYQFDQIQNPVERLVELMSMIAKFSVLSSDDWRDLYEMESDTIEYNYDHYFSQNYLKCLEKFR
jgi:hypothetical protein